MGWSALGTQFCLMLAFGVLFALAFVPKAPVGTWFYRLMGTAALVPMLCAFLMPVLAAGGSWSQPVVIAAGAGVASYPVYSGPFRGRRWGVGLGVGLLGSAVALGLQVAGSGRLADAGPLPVAVGIFTALSTGAVAGSVGLAMVLGHWYLTIPKLEVKHLVRLNRVTVGCMLASLVALLASAVVDADLLADGPRPLTSPFGLFYIGTRAVVGLALPLLFAWMTASSLRYGNTRSATGILYASTVLVMIGSAISVALQDLYGVPL